MNYIFLDIDGVLNSQKYVLKTDKKKDIPRIERNFDQRAIKRLGKICKQNHAQVILSSSWRYGFNKIMEHDQEDVYSSTLNKYFKKYDIKIIERTTLEHMDRGAQINKYIREHLRYADNYLIIDDEIKDIIVYIAKDKVVKTQFKTGLLYKHVRQCRKIFKRQQRQKK